MLQGMDESNFSQILSPFSLMYHAVWRGLSPVCSNISDVDNELWMEMSSHLIGKHILGAWQFCVLLLKGSCRELCQKHFIRVSNFWFYQVFILTGKSRSFKPSLCLFQVRTVATESGGILRHFPCDLWLLSGLLQTEIADITLAFILKSNLLLGPPDMKHYV